MKKKLLTEAGQSTIEFVISFSILFALVIFIYKIGFNYAKGFLIHHMTFMASRAYLIADNGENDTNVSAFEAKIKSILCPELVTPGEQQACNDLKFNNSAAGGGTLPVYNGVYTTLTEKFSFGVVGAGKTVKFWSESLIGKEPRRQEVLDQICNAFRRADSSVDCEGQHLTYVDNGD